MTTMYPAKINSPVTQLSAAITISATTVPVVDADVLPTAPNLATIGTGEDAETILYGAKSDDNLTSVTREFQGTKKAWPSGTSVYRAPTAYDHDTFKSNIEMILPIGATAYVIASNASTAVKAYGAFLRGLGFLVWVCADNTNNEVEINAALAAAGNADVSFIGSPCVLGNTVTVQADNSSRIQSLTFAPGTVIYPSSNVDLFHVGLGGRLSGGIIRTDSAYTGVSFSSVALTFTYSVGYIEHIDITGTEGAGTGTAISLPGSDSHSITYNRGDDIKIAGFEYGIYSACGTHPTFINTFTRVRIMYTVHPIYEVKGTESIHGNTYDFTYQAWHDAAKDTEPVMTIAGLDNTITGKVYDFVGAGYIIELTSDSSKNKLELFGVPVAKVHDSGTLNVFHIMNTSYLKMQVIYNATHNFNGAYAYSDTALVVANNTVTPVPFEHHLSDDVGSYHSDSVNNTRLTIPVTGWYLVTGNVVWDTGTGVREMWIREDGATPVLAYDYRTMPAAGDYSAQGLSTILYLVATHYLEVTVRQTSGGNLNVLAAYGYLPNFKITYLGSWPL